MIPIMAVHKFHKGKLSLGLYFVSAWLLDVRLSHLDEHILQILSQLAFQAVYNYFILETHNSNSF